MKNSQWNRPGRWRNGGVLNVKVAKALVLSLLVDTFVLTLDLGDNWLQGDVVAAVAEMLEENSCVSGGILGMAIAENIGLKEFKISWSRFHSEGAAALAKGFSNDHISMEGALHIAAGLKENKTLKRLNMRNFLRKDKRVNKELAELCDAVKILLLNHLLR